MKFCLHICMYTMCGPDTPKIRRGCPISWDRNYKGLWTAIGLQTGLGSSARAAGAMLCERCFLRRCNTNMSTYPRQGAHNRLKCGYQSGLIWWTNEFWRGNLQEYGLGLGVPFRSRNNSKTAVSQNPLPSMNDSSPKLGRSTLHSPQAAQKVEKCFFQTAHLISVSRGHLSDLCFLFVTWLISECLSAIFTVYTEGGSLSRAWSVLSSLCSASYSHYIHCCFFMVSFKPPRPCSLWCSPVLQRPLLSWPSFTLWIPVLTHIHLVLPPGPLLSVLIASHRRLPSDSLRYYFTTHWDVSIAILFASFGMLLILVLVVTALKSLCGVTSRLSGKQVCFKSQCLNFLVYGSHFPLSLYDP